MLAGHNNICNFYKNQTEQFYPFQSNLLQRPVYIVCFCQYLCQYLINITEDCMQTMFIFIRMSIYFSVCTFNNLTSSLGIRGTRFKIKNIKIFLPTPIALDMHETQLQRFEAIFTRLQKKSPKCPFFVA